MGFTGPGVVYFGFSGPNNVGGGVVALLAADGTFVWSVATVGPVTSTPSLAVNNAAPSLYGTVLVGCMAGKLYALDGASGDHVWVRDLGTGVTSTVVVMAQLDMAVFG